MARLSTLISFALLGAGAASGSEAGMNPIRKVVNLLQQMQQKVTEEGEKEKELYDKFICYCKNGAGDLDASIGAAGTKITSLGSEIEAAEQKKAQDETDLKQHQVDRDAAIKAMAEAEALREKEAAVYASVKADHGANAAALDKAIKAIEKGMAGAFLQSYSADVLRKLAVHMSSEEDRNELTAFLSAKSASGYAPASGEITGILKTMLDEMNAGFAEATSTEEAAIAAFEELMAAKKKEKEVLSASIEKKTARIGELGVSIAQMKNDLTDTEEALLADQKFKAELKKSCDTKTAEWEERSKTRAEELVALADTIKILNDDDALELFKATLPSASASASFVEMAATRDGMRRRAVALLQEVSSKVGRAARPQLDLIALALHGKKIGFEKVIGMIDKMVESLKTEQADDDHKKEYCVTQLDQTDDAKKGLERKVADHETEIANAEEAIATLKEEIKALQAGIKALDKSVAEATENRKQEHEEYNQLMASNSAAKEVLQFAKNRLNKFYNPALYKAPAKKELSREGRIAANMGGAFFAQISQHVQHGAAPPPPPETFGAYTKKSEENNGVMEMVNLLIKDLDKEMTEAETEEKDSQGDYESLMADSAEKRAADSKSLTEKEAAKADTEAALEKHTEDKASANKELAATLQYIQSLHSECDWILQYHEMRKDARDSEIDALGKAKAVLSGADYSLLQRSRSLRGSI